MRRYVRQAAHAAAAGARCGDPWTSDPMSMTRNRIIVRALRAGRGVSVGGGVLRLAGRSEFGDGRIAVDSWVMVGHGPSGCWLP